MKPKAIALLRVSSSAQAGPDRFGLPAQRIACERIAAAHGVEVVEWVELDGVSGVAVLADPRFAALLRRLQAPDVAAVVVAAFDRLFRRGQFSDYAILDAFRETGTRLLTSDGELDLATDAGGLLGVLRGELAAMERRAITDRTMRGRRRKRRERGVRAEGPVGMPRGVRFDYDAERWEYVWPEAARVRRAFELFLTGERNLAAIARKTGIGSGSEPSGAIRRVLSQPLYTGIYRVDRTWEGRREHALPPDQVQEHEVLNPPLVTRSEFAAAQRLLAMLRGSRPPRRQADERPGVYNAALLCSTCGGAVIALQDSRGYGAYVCSRGSRARCERRHQLSVRVADRVLDAELERLLGDLDTLRLLLDATTRTRARDESAAARELERRAAQLENRRARLLDAFEMGALAPAELRKRIGAVDAERAAVAAAQDAPGALEVVPDEVMADLVEVFASWASLRSAERRALLAAWRIEVYVEIEWKAIRVDRLRIGALPGDVWLYNYVPR